MLLAWVQDEKRDDPTEMQGVGRVAEAFQRRDVSLTTSVLTHIEVLPSAMASEAQSKYNAVFKPGGFDQQGITGSIITLARTIRDKAKQAGRTISTPDAIHLATAITVRVDEFHTFDGSSTAKKNRKLIPLNGDAVVEKLKICRPDYKAPIKAPPVDPKQTSLFDQPPVAVSGPNAAAPPPATHAATATPASPPPAPASAAEASKAPTAQPGKPPEKPSS